MIRVTLGVDFMGKEWLDMMRSVGMIAVIRCHVWLLQSLDKEHSNAKMVTTCYDPVHTETKPTSRRCPAYLNVHKRFQII